MATKGYKDNEQQAFTPTPTDWLGIQQGSLLSDMKKITYKDLTDPLQGQIDDHEQRVDDLELAEGSIKGVGWTGASLQSLDENKADKDTDAVVGNFASFDASGNPVDSGKKDSDYENADVTILKKAQVVDGLESELTDVPLSANQGRVLKDAQDVLNGDVATEGSVAKAIDDALEPIEEDVAGLAGAGRTTETVKKNADAIALRELLSNKKTTLADNNDTYFPTQKAVNKGLNQTMAEMMGFAPRNLMTLFGTATVAETFAELRARAITGDFRTLRLGDYIDLPSLTIGADSVNPTVYPARTINNDYNRLRVEIVGFDDYYYVGNTAYPQQHHVTMMFRDIPTAAPFNETNTTAGDYPGSMLFHWLHEQIEPALISVIGLTPRPVDRIIGTVANWGWVGSETIFLPTNVNIFGTTGFSHTNYGTGTQTQFALFAMNPNRKIKRRNGSRYYWWLAEPSANSSAHFCSAYYCGHATSNTASGALGVVPAFLI